MTRAPYAGAAGSRDGAIALLLGVAHAIEFEGDSATDEDVHEALVFLLAHVLDCLDDLDGTAGA